MQYDVKKSMMDAVCACQEIQEFTKGHTLETYKADLVRRRAVERSFEILGEAFKRVDDIDPSFRDRFLEMGKVIGARNRIIHGYDRVSDVVIWNAVQDNVPALMDKLAAWLKENP